MWLIVGFWAVMVAAVVLATFHDCHCFACQDKENNR